MALSGKGGAIYSFFTKNISDLNNWVVIKCDGSARKHWLVHMTIACKCATSPLSIHYIGIPSNMPVLSRQVANNFSTDQKYFYRSVKLWVMKLVPKICATKFQVKWITRDGCKQPTKIQKLYVATLYPAINLVVGAPAYNISKWLIKDFEKSPNIQIASA